MEQIPKICPYCQREEHKDIICREMKRNNRNPDWASIAIKSKREYSVKPRRISDWQRMFFTIYETPKEENYSFVFARFTEELGELAEALRIHPIAPRYFLSEAADVFRLADAPSKSD